MERSALGTGQVCSTTRSNKNTQCRDVRSTASAKTLQTLQVTTVFLQRRLYSNVVVCETSLFPLFLSS